MIRSIVLDLAVAITPSQGAAAPLLAVDDALAAADLAAASGVDALRIVDLIAGGAALEGSVAAAYLAGAEPDIGFLVDAPTSHNAPYNLARRLLSIDRATGGRSGLVLRPGRGNAVSELTAPDPAARDVRERWAEYAGIVTRLWESFPAAALLGDQESGIFAEESLISPIDHLGRYYRVAGPLDGPSSRQGRPVLAVADAELLGWDVVAAAANIVLVNAPARPQPRTPGSPRRWRRPAAGARRSGSSAAHSSRTGTGRRRQPETLTASCSCGAAPRR